MDTAIKYIRNRVDASAANSMPETYEIQSPNRHDATGRQMSG